MEKFDYSQELYHKEYGRVIYACINPEKPYEVIVCPDDGSAVSVSPKDLSAGPEFDHWDALDPRIKYLAMDNTDLKSRHWCGYVTKPEFTPGFGWSIDHVDAVCLPMDCLNPSWFPKVRPEDSLIERPQGTGKLNVSDWVEYVAMDADGSWWGFGDKPNLDSFYAEWVDDTSGAVPIDPGELPDISYDSWTDALFKINDDGTLSKED